MKKFLRLFFSQKQRIALGLGLKKMHSFLNRMSWYPKKLLVNLYYPEIVQLPVVPKSDAEHLQASIDWLSVAQDKTKSGGVSAWFDLSTRRWRIAYRETTGYIMETFVDYYKLTGNKQCLERAKAMADWEIEVLSNEGGVGEPQKNGEIAYKIFNAGQVILGLCPLFNITKEERYLEAAKKIADWVVINQDIDGGWSKYSNKGPKTIDSRVSWALLLVYQETKDEKYRDAARKNIAWTVAQQKNNFWFANTSILRNREPWTHAIAYTISGLLESYLLGEKDERIYKSFYGASKKMLECFQNTKTSKGFLPCSFDKNWNSKDDYSCLTGNAQLAIIWFKIYKLTGENEFLKAAHEILDQIKTTQILETSREEIKGGILASYPYYGDYSPFLLINWAPKFFADALILKNKTK